MQFTRNRAGEQILDVQEDKQTAKTTSREHCRHCKGNDHWSTHCPYKVMYQLDEEADAEKDAEKERGALGLRGDGRQLDRNRLVEKLSEIECNIYFQFRREYLPCHELATRNGRERASRRFRKNRTYYANFHRSRQDHRSAKRVRFCHVREQRRRSPSYRRAQRHPNVPHGAQGGVDSPKQLIRSFIFIQYLVFLLSPNFPRCDLVLDIHFHILVLLLVSHIPPLGIPLLTINERYFGD